MGFMTVVVVSNDYAHEIEEQPSSFIKKLITALRTGEGAKLPGVRIHPSRHADNTQLVGVGGNCSTVVHEVYGHSHHNRESQVELLRTWADELGFDIVEKS